MAVLPGFGATPDKYQGKTAIPLVARTGFNPRRALTLPMLLVIVSRVTKGSDLGITPIHDGDDLSHLLKLQWSEDCYLLMNFFHPVTGRVSLELMKAAKINYDNQSTQTISRNIQSRQTRSEASTESPSHIPALSRRRPRNNDEEVLSNISTNNSTVIPKRNGPENITRSSRAANNRITTRIPRMIRAQRNLNSSNEEEIILQSNVALHQHVIQSAQNTRMNSSTQSPFHIRPLSRRRPNDEVMETVVTSESSTLNTQRVTQANITYNRRRANDSITTNIPTRINTQPIKSNTNSSGYNINRPILPEIIDKVHLSML